MVGLDPAKQTVVVLGMRGEEGKAKEDIVGLAAQRGLPAHQIFNILGQTHISEIPHAIVSWIESQGVPHDVAMALHRDVAQATLSMVLHARLMGPVH